MESFNVFVINTPPSRCYSPDYNSLYLRSFVSEFTKSSCRYIDLNAKLFSKIRRSHFINLGNLTKSGYGGEGIGTNCMVSEAILNKIWMPFRVSFKTITIERNFDSVSEIIDFASNIRNLPFLALIEHEILSVIDNAQIIMFSIRSLEQLISAISISKMAKSRKSEIKVLWSGNIPTHFSYLFERNPDLFSYTDAIAVCDTEMIGVKYVEHCMNQNLPLSNVPGIMYLENGEIKKTEVLSISSNFINDLKIVDYSDVSMDDYPGEKTIIPLMASKECYYRRCAFCINYDDSGHIFRCRSTSNIIEDVLNAKSTCGARYFRFIDDCLPVNVAVSFSKALIELGIDISWGANIRCERAFCNPEVLQLLQLSGCKILFMGIESASDRVLRLMNKGITSSQAQDVINCIHNAGICVHASFLFGFPEENENDAQATCDFIFKNIDTLDLIEINYFVLLSRSKISIEMNKSDNSIVRHSNPFSEIDSRDQEFLENGKGSFSYSCYCIMRREIERRSKTPSFERVRKYYGYQRLTIT